MLSAAPVAVHDQGMDLTGEQVDPGEHADSAVALVLVIARESLMSAGLRWQVRGRGGDRLHARLLVVRDDRHDIARRLLLQQLDLAIDAQHLF
jgi:hypothetical protein